MRFKTQNETCKTSPNWEGQRHEIPASDDDELLSLMGDVLDALEAAEHPQAEAAYNDPATKDAASASERKAWLAIYGPLTDVLID